MFIPFAVLYGFTFPGVMVHELSHLWMCWLTRTKVISVNLFQLGPNSGYVVCDRGSNVWSVFAVSVVPFFVNTGTALIIGGFGARFYRSYGPNNFLTWLSIYLAFSVGFHAFPSLQDIKVVDDRLWEKSTMLFSKIILAPIVLIFGIVALGGNIAVNLLSGFGFGILIPFMYIGVR